MSAWKKSAVTGLHDPTTGALVGFLGLDGNEYLFQGLTGPLGTTPEILPYKTVTAATDTVAANDEVITANFAGTVTETLPAAASNAGRMIVLRTITANTVVSASANVVPLIGGSAGTAILAATAGKWAWLVSDGTAWQIVAGN